MISRRSALIGMSLTAAVTPPRAQPRSPARVALLSPSPSSIDLFLREARPIFAAAGWLEGVNLVFDRRSTEGRPEAMAVMAEELWSARPDVAIAVSNPAAHALRTAGPSLPVVMAFAGNDPVADGLVQSLSNPRTLVTGVVMLADELNVKRLEIARELSPGGGAIGLLTSTHLAPRRIELLRRAAEGLGLKLAVIEARAGESDPLDLPSAFRKLASAAVDSVVIASSPVLAGAAADIAALAAETRLATVAEWRSMAEAGCLVSYGPNGPSLRRLAAHYAIRILNGESPGDMPMQLPARLELVVNLRTARRIGRNVPLPVLARADEVIE